MSEIRAITTHRRRSRREGSFKRKTRTRKNGSAVTFFEGYVYSADGKKCFGSGPTLQKAEENAKLNASIHEKRLPALIAAAFGSRATQPDANRAAPSDNIHVTFADPYLYDQVKEYIQGRRLSRKSRVKYEGFGKNLCDPQFFRSFKTTARSLGDMRLGSIEKAHINAFLDAYEKKFTPRSAYNCYVFIKQVFRDAHEEEHTTGLKRNPAVRLKPRVKARKRRVPLSWQQMWDLVESCTDPHLRAFLTVANYGLRIGEIAALTEDCKDAAGRIHVRCTQSYLDAPNSREDEGSVGAAVLGLGPTKTEKSDRLVLITPEHWQIINEATSRAREVSVYIEGQGWTKKRFLVPNKLGGQWKADGIRLALKKYLATQGLPGVRPHDWRASVVTNLLDGPAKDKEGLAKVSRFVGHSSIATTADLYYQFTQTANDQVGKTIADKLRAFAKRISELRVVDGGKSDSATA